MTAQRSRHGVSSGGRPVHEILARVSTSPAHAAALAPQRSVFTVAAAAAVGAGTAAASITGTFPAIKAPTLFGTGDSQSVAHIVEPVAEAAPAAAPALVPAQRQAPAAEVIPAPQAAPIVPVASALAKPALDAPKSAKSGATGGTVMATDLHQADANEIASLSRAMDLNRAAATPAPAAAPDAAQAVAGVLGGVGSVVENALALPSKIGGVPIVGLAGSKGAATALKNAATKLGKPYVWGAVGPSSFDCSGLMMWAYKQAGINIPRTSKQQSSFGTPVSTKDLKPGDMVFYYSPVSHVGMYIGNGKILHASEAGQPVKISNVNAFPIHNARRIIA
ncbi:C40 family peptidase [Pseudonocardia spinosispora]|uniref:C40 family peptidase n=1 Tax=Pseudonocardia spinosispora TaxID=103441 RepID=UPI0009FC0F71|nr:NlpC/P60 family protein [Pseudonocardia spinosispora]